MTETRCTGELYNNYIKDNIFVASSAHKKQIRKAVVAELEKYRICKYLTFEEREARTTGSYAPRYHGNTNVTSDQTAQVAIYNADVHASRRAFCELIERTVNRLPDKERFLITERYLLPDSSYLTDLHVYSFSFDPPISEGTYTKIRDRAMYKLALMLNIDCGADRTTRV